MISLLGMFVHWSNTETTYRDMEQIEAFCNRCQANQLHTFRLYEQKTKHYSAFSIGANHKVTAICHGCLLESPLPKNEESMLIRTYKRRLVCAEGFELYDKGKIDKAIKKFRNVLKDDPEQSQALFGISKSLIAQGNFDEAKVYVDKLSMRFPEHPEVKDLKAHLVRNVQ